MKTIDRLKMAFPSVSPRFTAFLDKSNYEFEEYHGNCFEMLVLVRENPLIKVYYRFHHIVKWGMDYDKEMTRISEKDLKDYCNFIAKTV